jgi:predicted acetyltransferase
MVIQRCGGLFESAVPGEAGSRAQRRYWIDLVSPRAAE